MPNPVVMRVVLYPKKGAFITTNKLIKAEVEERLSGYVTGPLAAFEKVRVQKIDADRR